jgi:tetratricopeptide (TPR) repeat protein
LQLAARQPNPFREESEVILSLVEEFSETGSGNALADLKRITAQNPDNLLYNFVYCWMLKKQKMGPDALRNVISRPQGEAYLPFAFYHHMAADLYLYRSEWEKSIAENKRYLQEYKGHHYLKDSRYKIYLAYQMLNQPAEAEKYLNAIPKAGAQLIEEDQHAQRLAEKPERLVKPLMRARLLHDGGYYSEALNVLEEFEKSRYARTKKDQLELIYRKARIYHALEQTDKAEVNYLRTISLSGTEPYYYAPNAALQLGYLYLDRRDKANARKYFQKALDYRGHEYESSIESKAKLALERL